MSEKPPRSDKAEEEEEIEQQPPAPPTADTPTAQATLSPLQSKEPVDEPPDMDAEKPVVTEPVEHYRIPAHTKCPNCDSVILTNVTYKNGLCVWLSCAGCVAIGGILGCCLIPFFVKSFKDVDHACPKCYYRLGVCKAL